MPAIEDELWEKIVKSRLPSGETVALNKKQQQALTVLLQNWVADCVLYHLSQLAEGLHW